MRVVKKNFPTELAFKLNESNIPYIVGNLREMDIQFTAKIDNKGCSILIPYHGSLVYYDYEEWVFVFNDTGYEVLYTKDFEKQYDILND